MKKETSMPTPDKKTIFDDPRLEKLNELSYEELFDIMDEINEEFKSRHDPLERLQNEYKQKTDNLLKELDGISIQQSATLDQFSKLGKDLSEGNPVLAMGKSLDEMRLEMDSESARYDRLSETLSSTLESSRQIFANMNEIFKKYHQLIAQVQAVTNKVLKELKNEDAKQNIKRAESDYIK